MKITITILAFVLTALMANATIRVVNNRTDLPLTPGQYTTIQAAVTATSAGDTILVAGSATAYSGTINVKKNLLLLDRGIILINKSQGDNTRFEKIQPLIHINNNFVLHACLN